ncbi:MAG TPA: trypsin-like peptidase domain-containing protein, partial [Thermohalobaculum sp.]|nr:trypsin-like peptidase domain-containing protein [Thermohalobaculum sp.]
MVFRNSTRPLAKLVAIGATISSLLVSEAARSEIDCSALVPTENVVEISVDGQNREGSGIILTYDGYVLTAAHLILGDIAEPYPLAVSVKRSNDMNWLSARIKRIDPVLDLALLKLAKLPDRPSLSAVVRQSLGDVKVGEFCLAGFGLVKDPRGNVIEYKPYLAVSAAYQGEERGHILADKQIAAGYSGGGAFRDGALLGLIVRRKGSPVGTYIVPTEFILDFIASEGIYLDNNWKFEPGVPASDLSVKIENIRRKADANQLEIERILRSVEWLVELQPDHASGPQLVLTPRRSFPHQIVDGTFIAAMTVYFDDPDFEGYIANNRPLTTDIGIKIETDGAVVIDDL